MAPIEAGSVSWGSEQRTALTARTTKWSGAEGVDAMKTCRSRSSTAMAVQLLVVLSVLLLVGCARGQSALEGTQWRLTEWTLSSLNPRDFDITAEFADGKIGGRGGVNSYGGPYTLRSRHAFAVGPPVSTEMAGPELAMRAEDAYLVLLGQARSYRVDAGRLTLFDADGTESLIFEAAGLRP
jgi:heat shock protein HslJ